MSVDLDWSALDYHLTSSVTQFLAEAFSSAPRPNFIGPLTVERFSFGDSQPCLELVDIRDVYKEFLQPDDDELEPPDEPAPPLAPPITRTRTRSRSPHPHPHGHGAYHSDSHTHPHSYSPPSPTPSLFSHDPLSGPTLSSAPSPSFQVHLHLTYSGTLSLGLATSLVINYPNDHFMSLPVAVTLTSLALETTLVVAFEGGNRRVHLSLLDPNPSIVSTRKDVNQGPGSRILKSAVIESEVGQHDKHVLKNVGKVEKFVLEVARRTLDNEIVFPNFQTIMF
ncbi:ERMES complex subunit MDM12 [Sporobolomyces koalae]|uniref:ERMES complex subunit MDM12 n=1 Tax=Sporobolomyces koalae TaxID=500713 RepID=UPI00317E99A8